MKIIGILLLLPYNVYIITLVSQRVPSLIQPVPSLMQFPNLFFSLFFSTSSVTVDSTYLLLTSNALGFCLLLLGFFVNIIPKRQTMKKRRQTKEELELSERMRLALEKG